MAKFEEISQVVKQESIATDIYDLTLKAPKIAREAHAGQFVSVYCEDGAHLLPRPISLCGVDKEAGTIRLVYRIAGYGTNAFSKLTNGQGVKLIGPLGNGFTMPASDKKVILLGGGIGIPPMRELAKELLASGLKKENIQIVVGYRNELFLVDDLNEFGLVFIASEDGQHGTKGNVMDAIAAEGITGDILYACGPTPMLRAIKAYAGKNRLECYLSLEERMACGIGACLGCVCKSKDVDHHSYVKNKRVCADGPVFLTGEIEL